MTRIPGPFHWTYLLLLILLFFVLPLKDTSVGESAQAEYDHAARLFHSGYLALSQQEAEFGVRQYHSSNPAWASRFTLLEANTMLYRGMYEDALRLLATYRGSAASDDGEVEKLAIEAVALTRQQQISTAEQRINQAEVLCRTADFDSCGDAIAARAILSAKIGQLAQAKQSFLQMQSFARSHHDSWLAATATLNLGYTAMQVNHYDEAVDWSELAYQEAAKFNYENIEQVAAGNLGWAYFQLGDHVRALEQFDTAEKGATRLGSIRHQLKWLSDAGYVYRDSGDWPRAAQAYRRALFLARQIDSKEDIVNALEDLARLSVMNGNLNEADEFIAQLAAMETGPSIGPSATLRLTMGELAAARGQSGQAKSCFHAVQDDRSAMVTTKLSAGFELAKLFERQNDAPAADRMYKSTLSMYEAARAQLKSEESELPFGTNAADIYDEYIHFLVHSGKSETALEVADQSRAQTLERGLGEASERKHLQTAAFNPQQISQRTRSTLLFYWLGAQESYLWAITPAKTQLFVLPSQQEIAQRVEGYSKVLLEAQNPLEEGNADGEALYRMLILPAASLIPPTSPVIVLTDGMLSQLNFETLLVAGDAKRSQRNAGSDAPAHYLIDDLTLYSAPSLAMLAGERPAQKAKPNILLMGNPDSPDRDFPSLPLFGLEMTRIEGHFSSSEVLALAGQQATPSAYFASDPGNYTYIHFVSHAVASSTSPLDSAIILSDPAGHENSYKLYAREIIQHPIQARLVTISACYGTGTRAYAGEGLVGLSWAFLDAGAQRVIGALWEVSDDSTPRLMDKLYERLSAGDSPAVALRVAKLSLLHSQSKFRAPFYWAPFQLYSR